MDRKIVKVDPILAIAIGVMLVCVSVQMFLRNSSAEKVELARIENEMALIESQLEGYFDVLKNHKGQSENIARESHKELKQQFKMLSDKTEVVSSDLKCITKKSEQRKMLSGVLSLISFAAMIVMIVGMVRLATRLPFGPSPGSDSA